MPQYRATVGPDGAVTLPVDLRERLRIREGCEVEFFVTVDGDVFFHAITGRAKDWTGKFDVEIRSPPISIEEMDQGIAEHIVEDYERIARQNASGRRRSRRPAAERSARIRTC